jgi:ubiquinone biosynthesis accessory factor UbiJ
MLHTLQQLLAPAALERLTLVLNHVLGSEAVATERLRPHAGRLLAVELVDWPSLLPDPPPLWWRITPAGLLEWGGLHPQGAPGEVLAPAADLRLRLDASNPALLFARSLAGEQPEVQIEGDARLAGEINWLIQNLRWDAAADLERLFGPVVAAQVVKLGSALGQGLRTALRGAQALGERLRPRAAR